MLWRAGIVALAENENVWCKLSGVVTEADHAAWTIDDFRVHIDVVLEAFGPSRLLWGSDWPVVTLAATHKRWRQATDELLGRLSPDERHAIRSGNAAEVYRLDQQHPATGGT